jgi:hypothetical protein
LESGPRVWRANLVKAARIALWTAADQQLERSYAHDPEAKGFGIYGVLWLGDKRRSPMPKHPNGLELPKSPAELEQMLRDRIPADRHNRLAVLVIDVSGPPAVKRKRQTSAKTKKKSAGTKTKAAKPALQARRVGKR